MKTDTRKQYEIKWLETESHKTYFGNEMEALAFAHFLENFTDVVKIDVTKLTGDDCLIRTNIFNLKKEVK